jgi:hypothetical protein
VNPARLAELNHQRALVWQHLAWLEREIEKESTGFTPPSVVATPSAVPSAPRFEPNQIDAEIEAYQPDPVTAASDTRRGCFTAVAVVAVIIIAALCAIYFLRYSDRPLFFVSAEK